MKDAKHMKTTKDCAVDECTRGVIAKSLCQKHYNRFKKHGDPLYERPNYIRKGDTCSMGGCETKQYAKLLCSKHYSRMLIHGDPNVYLHRHVCTMEDCNAKHKAHGYCAKHDARYVKYGDPHFLKEVGDKGRLKHRLYTRYRGMIDRCYYKKSAKYPRYGARGIRVCSRWLNRIDGFENYVRDIEGLIDSYRDNWTIDRINNDGDYEPSNVRWASPTVQVNNREMSKK